MTRSGMARHDRRVLLLVPTSRDAAITSELLESAGIDFDICPTLDALVSELERGAGALLLPEEALALGPLVRLQGVLARQPAWSDLPVLILTRTGAASAAIGDAVRTLGNVTLLERPVQVMTLLSSIRTSLRARERQMQIRGHLRERVRAEESLRLADRRKDEFLATLGHELRNPLAPLLSGLQLLRATAGDDPQVARISAVMERQIRHLVRLVDDLLEVSRITRGLIDIQHEPLDLGAVARAAIETSRPALEAAGHELIVDIDPSPVIVVGDAVRLTQVFANLLTNAAKYTNAGGLIHLSVTREAGRARLSVRDNGIGIDPAHLSAIFDMFMQVDRSNRRAQGGLGIGLTLVRSLVAMHGGRVDARSDGPGKGSEFVVELPVVDDSTVGADRGDRLEPLPSCRIMLVDDNRDVAETLGELLTSLGATVAVVNSGQEAIAQVAEFEPDAVLLDIGMPDMDGYEVSRRLRQMPNLDGLLIIALTGWGQDQDYRQSHLAGFDHHLVKPPDMHKLRALLMTGRAPSPVPAERRRRQSSEAPGAQ